MKRYLILILCITLTTISKLLIQKVQTKKYPVLHAKIYHIGLYRCGTTSVSYMFNKSNEVVHVQFLPYIIDYLNKKINLQTLSYVLKQREKLIDDFDSYGVYFLIYRELYKLNPNAKFIVTVRDMYSWINSIYNKVMDICTRRKLDVEYILPTVYIMDYLFSKYGYTPVVYDDTCGYFNTIFDTKLDIVIDVLVKHLSELLRFINTKQNILVIPLTELSTKKTLAEIKSFTNITVEPYHLNRQTIRYTQINRTRFHMLLIKYKTPELRELYNKYKWKY